MAARAFLVGAQHAGSVQCLDADSDGARARMIDGECLWQQSTTWRTLQESLRKLPSGLRVLDLCGGLSSGYLALSALLGSANVKLSGHFDIDDDLRPALHAIHGESRHVHLGNDGDIMNRAAAEFPDAEIVIAGPPCPPFSMLGKRGSFGDPRAAVFWKCIDVLTSLCERGDLMVFVLENVAGITKRPAGAEEAPVKTIIRELNKAMPQMQVEMLLVNTTSFGLPHSRPRVYIVGRRASVFCRGQPPSLTPFSERVALGQLLDLSGAGGARAYTQLQQSNISDFKDAYSELMNDPNKRGQFAVVDISRTPTARTAWSTRTQLHPDIVECLTASGPSFHVFALGEGRHAQLSVDRPLYQHERGRLQGFPERVCRASVSEAVAKRMFGNAMSVPVLGAVLGRELRALIRTVTTPALSRTARPSDEHGSSSSRGLRCGDAAQTSGSADTAMRGEISLPSSQDLHAGPKGIVKNTALIT